MPSAAPQPKPELVVNCRPLASALSIPLVAEHSPSLLLSSLLSISPFSLFSFRSGSRRRRTHDGVRVRENAKGRGKRNTRSQPFFLTPVNRHGRAEKARVSLALDPIQTGAGGRRGSKFAASFVIRGPAGIPVGFSVSKGALRVTALVLSCSPTPQRCTSSIVKVARTNLVYSGHSYECGHRRYTRPSRHG
jgi:hypothetical protein